MMKKFWKSWLNKEKFFSKREKNKKFKIKSKIFLSDKKIFRYKNFKK